MSTSDVSVDLTTQECKQVYRDARINSYITEGRLIDALRMNEGMPLICWAARTDAIAVAKKLLDGSGVAHCSDVNEEGFYGRRALFLAQSEEMVHILLDAGADVNALDNDNSTALFSAIGTNNSEKTTLLLAAGADPNVESLTWTPLFCGILNKSYECVELLLDAGANVHTKFVNEHTLLMISTLLRAGKTHEEIADKCSGVSASKYAQVNGNERMQSILRSRG